MDLYLPELLRTAHSVIAPDIAMLHELEHYKKILGNAFVYDEDTDCLKPDTENALYDIDRFIKYGIHAFNHVDVVNKIIDENMPVREVCDINSVQDWFRYEFLYLAKGNVLYKQCKNCVRFFIPSSRSYSEYCDRIDAVSGKTRKEVGAINTFAKKHENDEIHQAYTKTYRRMDSRKRTMYISKKEFSEWSKTAREKRKLCEDGIITLEEILITCQRILNHSLILPFY